jgi:hypothetical protein
MAFTADWWDSALSDAETLLSRWGSVAHSLEWSCIDLLEWRCEAPGACLYIFGLLTLPPSFIQT